MSSENERDDDRKHRERSRENRAGGNSRPQRPGSGGTRGGSPRSSNPRNADSRPRSSSPRSSSPRSADSRGSSSRGDSSRSESARGEGPRSGGQRSGSSWENRSSGRDGSRSGGPRTGGPRSSGPRAGGGGRYDAKRSDGGSRPAGAWSRDGKGDDRSDSRSRDAGGRGRPDSGPRSGSRGDSGRRGSEGYGRGADSRGGDWRSGSDRGGSSERRTGGPGGDRRGGGDYRGGGERRGSGGEFRGRGPARDSRSGGSRPDSRGGSQGSRDRDAVRRDDRRNERDDGSRRGDRSGQRAYIEAPEVPDDIHISQLDKEVRQRLRTLSKDNAEDVGQHLVMAGALIEIDPELAYKHAQVAVARGGRVDVVREAGALTAYATGRYAEALRELRTVRRLSGSNEHLPLMADCERGLGRPERAIDLARSDDAATLGHRGSVEMEIVAAGARLDLGQAEAAYVALKRIETTEAALQSRIDTAMVDVLRALGRDAQADTLEATLEDTTATPYDNEIEYDITVYDVAELPEPEPEDEPAAEHSGSELSEEDSQ